MAHQTAKQVEEELAKQNEGDYGDEAPGGHMASPDSDDDVELPMQAAFGDDAIEDIASHKPFSVARELNEDEEGAGGFTSPAEAKENIKKSEKKTS